ncbi:uncharacterized protein [Haliotis asinina]|uniref:uncharacterized protein n=1 Tax=Haliotis asinina TaxID=109174 RepID=UPI0035325242
MTTPTPGDNAELYRTTSKQVLVTRDPVLTHPAIYQGHYIGPQPHTYMPLAIVVTILNPLIGPFAIFFAYMSSRAYGQGDLKYANKWSQYAFMMGMITIVASVLIYITIGFALSPMGIKGSHSL